MEIILVDCKSYAESCVCKYRVLTVGKPLGFKGLKYYVTDFCQLLSTSQLHHNTTLHDLLVVLQLCQINYKEEVKNHSGQQIQQTVFQKCVHFYTALPSLTLLKTRQKFCKSAFTILSFRISM
jgi:hypothetical protein